MRTLLAVGLLWLVGAGCTFLTAAQTVQGKAYLIRNEYISSSFWNCEAPGGEPVCYQTKKQFTRQPEAK
jgi:hypothetical protein